MSFKSVLNNYKTTLIGMIGAAAQVGLPLYQTGAVSKEQMIGAMVFAALGYFAEDAKKTQQP
jgi:hypothetical protein